LSRGRRWREAACAARRGFRSTSMHGWPALSGVRAAAGWQGACGNQPTAYKRPRLRCRCRAAAPMLPCSQAGSSWVRTALDDELQPCRDRVGGLLDLLLHHSARCIPCTAGYRMAGGRRRAGKHGRGQRLQRSGQARRVPTFRARQNRLGWPTQRGGARPPRRISAPAIPRHRALHTQAGQLRAH
jgi:hypothetical protein